MVEAKADQPAARAPSGDADAPELLVDDALALRVVLTRFGRRTREECERAGLTPQLYVLLLLLAEGHEHDRSVADLARTLGIGQPTVSELLGKALRSQLLQRTQLDRDRRRARFALTAEGRSVLMQVYRALREDRRGLLDGVLTAMARGEVLEAMQHDETTEAPDDE